MMMNMQEESSETSNDHQTVVKGKRTKCPRPSASSMATSSSTGGGELSNSSGVAISTSTEEDEDMANCLILLARGGGSPEGNNKVSSRKFTEMATTTNGKVGFYVYECKTCSRTFPSFQALGGHRASHKKPKVVHNDNKNSPPSTVTDHVQEDEKSAAPPPLAQSVFKFNKSCHGGETSKPKVHECLICGTEFASGQALGGHMRRHRSAVISTRSSTNDHSSSSDDGEKAGGVLVLDLNLPAPPEDDRRKEKFYQLHPVFSSSAAVVDCHF